MSKGLLEQIYNGEFSPGTDYQSKDPEFRPLRRKIGAEYSYFMDILSGEDRERFDNLYTLICNAEEMEKFATFSCGLSAGMRLVWELMAEESHRAIL